MQKWLLLGLPAVVAAALIVLVLSPEWREAVQNRMNHTGREVLATAEGDLLNDGSTTKVIKYRGQDGIYVEILKMTNGESSLIDRILLPDKHDGLFNFHGHVTRLAITDIDNDGKQVLLAPTFDNQLVPHLNVFRYNSATAHFELYSKTK